MIRPTRPPEASAGPAGDRPADEASSGSDRLIAERPARPAAAEAPDAYAEIAELYDLEHAGFDDDVEMYRQFARVTDGPVLELACGSGRILAPLVADGHRVAGLDRSRPMLDRARELLRSVEGPPATLVEAGMDAAATLPGGPFGLVVIGLNSLLHAGTQAEQRAVLAAARDAAGPDGLLVVDVLNPAPQHLQALTGTALDGQWRTDDGGSVMKFSDRTVDAATQEIATGIWYDLVAPDGALRRVTTGFTLRFLHPSELLLLLELTGWTDLATYGSWELDPLSDDGERLIVTARQRPDGPSRSGMPGRS